jgi:predicted nucleic acid-binding protein
LKDGFVADASVGVAWAVPAQSSKAAEDLLDEVASGTPFVTPVLWSFEVANALVVLARRKRIQTEQAVRALRSLGLLTPMLDDAGPRLAFGKIASLAGEYELSVYDAAYLELAVRRRLPLASRDAALNKAAKLRGVKTLL